MQFLKVEFFFSKVKGMSHTQYLRDLRNFNEMFEKMNIDQLKYIQIHF